MRKEHYTRTIIAIMGIAAFCYAIFEAMLIGVYTWIPDAAFSILLIFFMVWKWKELKLNHFSFSLLILGFFLHCAGVFGFYGSSPLPLPWDTVTHAVGLFAAGAFFFFFFEDHLQKGKTFNKVFTLIIMLLASLGIGSLIENIEYAGYTFLGEGEGALYFGDGDGSLEYIDTDMMNFAGGGWFNAMKDLVVNLLGASSAIVVLLLYRTLSR